QQFLENIEEIVETPPTPFHQLAFFRINKFVHGKSLFPYYYVHLGKASINQIKTGSFIEDLVLQDSPAIYAIQSFWVPKIRKPTIKCRWGKIILLFSIERYESGIKLHLYKLRK
ncbi:MAG: hypothetical protein WCI04_07005, partial [archaeon]